jgi:hypothetical protein
VEWSDLGSKGGFCFFQMRFFEDGRWTQRYLWCDEEGMTDVRSGENSGYGWNGRRLAVEDTERSRLPRGIKGLRKGTKRRCKV